MGYLVTLLAIAGLAVGLSGFTFFYGRGHSYLSNDPKACVNCHIMRDQYLSWHRSPHASVTTCNSCHAPDNFVAKYFVKAENGLNHAFKFTTGLYNDPIRIRPHNFKIAMNACLKCHESIFHTSNHDEKLIQGKACMQCHKDVGHTH